MRILNIGWIYGYYTPTDEHGKITYILAYNDLNLPLKNNIIFERIVFCDRIKIWIKYELFKSKI